MGSLLKAVCVIYMVGQQPQHLIVITEDRLQN